jgi:hypothetical protein
LAWGVLFGLAPFSAVFYPVSVLPGWLQPVSLAIPATHVFEGMRAALLDGRLAWDHMAYAFGLDLIWLALAAWLFMAQYRGIAAPLSSCALFRQDSPFRFLVGRWSPLPRPATCGDWKRDSRPDADL